jgi:hypothetical protein
MMMSNSNSGNLPVINALIAGMSFGSTAASYLEPYWFLDDIVAARRLMMARSDDWGDECSYRRAVLF